MGRGAMTRPAELYACLYAKEFPAQAMLRLRSELCDAPCVVIEGESPLERVCSLNRRARSLGLVCGMTKVEVETFSNVTQLERSRHEEATTKTVLLECIGSFSPRVEDRSEDYAFLCALDIAGTESLLGPPEALARNLLKQIRSLAVTACVAVSRNLHAAVALAKGMSPRTPVKVIPAGEEGAVLAPLPLTVLDMTEDQAETLLAWGIRNLGMLAALPEKELIARMGQRGKQLRQLARGEMSHLFQPVELVFALEEHMELDSPVELLDALLFVVNVMLEQLILRANARILALASVSVTLTLEGGAQHSCKVRPALPSNDRQLWIKLLHLEMEAHPPLAAILALTLTAESGRSSKVQLGLFSPQFPEPARLDVTLALIRAIVGEGNVGRAVLNDTHRLDGFTMEPFSIPSGTVATLPATRTRSAIRRLRPAETILVTVQGQRPKSFIFRDKRYVVDRTNGPWLTSGDWWSSTLWDIEQWDIEARAQDDALLHCCVMRDRLRDRWHMAALYD